MYQSTGCQRNLESESHHGRGFDLLTQSSTDTREEQGHSEQGHFKDQNFQMESSTPRLQNNDDGFGKRELN